MTRCPRSASRPGEDLGAEGPAADRRPRAGRRPRARRRLGAGPTSPGTSTQPKREALTELGALGRRRRRRPTNAACSLIATVGYTPDVGQQLETPTTATRRRARPSSARSPRSWRAATRRRACSPTRSGTSRTSSTGSRSPDPARYVAVLRESRHRRSAPSIRRPRSSRAACRRPATARPRSRPTAGFDCSTRNGAKPWFDAIGRRPFRRRRRGPRLDRPRQPVVPDGGLDAEHPLDPGRARRHRRSGLGHRGGLPALPRGVRGPSGARGCPSGGTYPWAGVLAWFTYWDPNGTRASTTRSRGAPPGTPCVRRR